MDYLLELFPFFEFPPIKIIVSFEEKKSQSNLDINVK